jgi:hypothetical protein
MTGGGANDGKRFEPASLTLGVGTLFTVIAGFTLTGTVGRVLRNAPDDLVLAVILLVAGAAAFAAAGLTLSSGVAQTVLGVSGLILTSFGLLIGMVVSLRTADDAERPYVSAVIDESPRRVKGTVTAANLSSNTRVGLVVDGLVRRRQSGYESFRLQQVFIGPDAEGQVRFAIDAQFPPGRFDAIGVKSWTYKGKKPEDPPCGDYLALAENSGFPDAKRDDGSGCIILPLPPIPSAPRLSLSWAAETKQVRIGVATDNAPGRLFVAEQPCPPGLPPCAAARIAVHVRTRRGRQRDLYRAVLRPDATGHLRTAVEVPVPARARHICAQAEFIYDRASLPPADCKYEALETGRTAVSLHRAAAARRPASTRRTRLRGRAGS